MNTNPLTVVVLDTGVDKNHPQLKNCSVEVIDLSGKTEDGLDCIGHGTAVVYLLYKKLPNARIIMIKIFHHELVSDGEKLLQALRYVRTHYKPQLMNLSIGMTLCDIREELQEECNALEELGCIIVSAYDNGGVVSYPAAFKNTIGVDCSLKCKKPDDIFVVESESGITAVGYAGLQRLPWKNASYRSIGGSSFITPIVTGMLGTIIEKGISKKDMIFRLFMNNMIKKKTKKPDTVPKYSNFIKNAITFPFNKEIRTLYRFRKDLEFEWVGAYTIKGLLEEKEDPHDFIKDYKTIRWEENFDTVILGHLKHISLVTGRDYTAELLTKCLKHKKNIFSFDELNSYKHITDEMIQNRLVVYTPNYLPEYLPDNPTGKLRRISCPVICVAGTRSKLGKFSIQIDIRKDLLRRGYSIGQVGTEPSSQLVGMDAAFPYGYDSTVHLSGSQIIEAVNYIIGEIECKNPDIILLGLQSMPVPYSFGNLSYYMIGQTEIIWASEPDAFILLICPLDDLDYIERTINYLEGVAESKVIALVISPVPKYAQHTFLGEEPVLISDEVKEAFYYNVLKRFHIPTYFYESVEDVNKLTDEIESYFS